jgi:uncharacterized protein DUF6915
MSKPYIHSLSSAKKFGGKPEDYIEIHNLMDSSKGAIADNRHRALTHNSWFLSVILEKIFGVTITNQDGKVISTRDIGEQHILEDFRGKFIPTAQDYLQEMEFKNWMQNGNGYPPSSSKIESGKKTKITEVVLPVIDRGNVTYDGPKPWDKQPCNIPISPKLVD